MFLRRRKHLSFEQLLDEFKECQPCAVSGALQVFLLYGRETALYLDDNAKLKMDIKGLVFKKPCAGACSTAEHDYADVVVVIMRRGKALCRLRASVGTARGEFTHGRCSVPRGT